MARLRVSVTTTQGNTVEYPVTPKTEVEFERAWNAGLGKVFTEQRKEHLYHLAWLAAKASGAEVKPFDGWLEGITDAELLVSDDPPTDARA
jgi:hypothetical protein